MSAPVIMDESISFLHGGGEMGKLIRSKNWSNTTVGNFDNWPQSLRTTLSILLNSRFPMFLFWGSEFTCFYNDAYRPSLGNDGKHPSILGAAGIDAWPEIWHIIKPLLDQVMGGGEATWSEDQLIPIYRNGKIEDVYWTFSYSPVKDETDKIAGVFVTCVETTGKIEHEKQKDDFIKMASHELKTPVTTIKGYTQLLLNLYSNQTDSMLTSSLTTIDKQISKLTKLITDLLDVTKMETGSFELQKEEFNIDELIREVTKDFQVTTSHNIALALQSDTIVNADKDRITQVLLNLLANATKYSPEANKIVITSHVFPNEVKVCIQDFGIGISPINQEKIFERFFRVQDKREQTYPGFGIGLYIVKEILVLHGGKVWVKSEKDSGSRFYFSLPLNA